MKRSWFSLITSRPLSHEQRVLLPFMRWRKGMLLFSLCLVLLSFVGVLGRGINFGIDFRGGLLLEFETAREPDLSALRSTMRGVVEGNVVVQEFGSKTVFLLRVQKPKPTNESNTRHSENNNIPFRHRMNGNSTLCS